MPESRSILQSIPWLYEQGNSSENDCLSVPLSQSLPATSVNLLNIKMENNY